MAQDFERVLKTSIGTSATEIRAAANSDDAIIGMRFANKGTTAVTVDATVKNSSTSYYLIKDAPIPAGGSLELIDGGSKVVLQSGDSVEALSDTASAVDCILSVVDSISTLGKLKCDIWETVQQKVLLVLRNKYLLLLILKLHTH